MTVQTYRQGTHDTTVEADPKVPTVKIVRDFDATPDRLFKAFTDRDLVSRWLGPRDTPMNLKEWDATTGGRYRYDAIRGGEVIASFYGSFHEVRPNERLVQTFTWEGMPDGVSLDCITFVDLGDGRTRVVSVSVLDSFESRDAMLASGMETGLLDGYEAIDEILAEHADA
jgi:uncharacterized protein YndB with AHSA1/START domain